MGNLHKWFSGSKSKDGKSGWVNVKTGGTCASDEPGEGTPKCVSSSKRASMTKSERESASRRKKAADPGQQQKSGAAKPTYVSTDKPKKMKKEQFSNWRDNTPEPMVNELFGLGKKKENKNRGAGGSWETSTSEARARSRGWKDPNEKPKPMSPFGPEKGTSKSPDKFKNVKKTLGIRPKPEPKATSQTKPEPKATSQTKTDPTPKSNPYSGKDKLKPQSFSTAVRSGTKMNKSTPSAPGKIVTQQGNQKEQFSNWRDNYVATEHEFIDLIKPEPMVGISEEDKKGSGSGKKDACYKKVKASASVWPSAYASGRLVQCRKKGAANWGNKSESIEYSDWRDDFKATEYEFFDIIKAEPLVSEGAMPDAIDPKAHRTAQRTKKIRDRTKTGDEGSTIAKKKLRGPSLPMEEVETVVEGQKCWKGYEKKGTKKMFGKVVNNCVKKEEFVDEAKHTATKSDLESKVGGGNLKKLTAKAVKRIDYDVDGDVDPNDKVEKKTGDYGEELPTPFGKFKTKIKKEEFSDWRNELDEGWKSALAGAGVAAALMSQGGQKAPDKKTTTSPSRSNTERVSKTTQKKLSPMDQWRKNHPKLANKSDNPPEFKRKKLSPINKDWAKANPKLAEKEKDNRSKLREAIDKSKMKCNSPKSQAVGDSQTGKSHVVKACEGGKEKIIRFGQRGVKGSPKKEGESKEYASRRNRFKTRHAKNISKGKMSAAYWSNKVKW